MVPSSIGGGPCLGSLQPTVAREGPSARATIIQTQRSADTAGNTEKVQVGGAARGAELGKGVVGGAAGAGVGSGAGSAPEAARGALLVGSSELGRGRSGERPCWRTPRRQTPLGARGSPR